MKLHFDNALIDFPRTLRTSRQLLEEYAPVNNFGKKTQCQEIRLEVIWAMTSWSCHANSNVNVTRIIVIAHLYPQLWSSFFQNFVNDDVGSTQASEVFSLKNPFELPWIYQIYLFLILLPRGHNENEIEASRDPFSTTYIHLFHFPTGLLFAEMQERPFSALI